MKTALIVPTLNAGQSWTRWLDALAAQTLQPDVCLVVDSSSTDDTVPLARARGLDVEVIKRAEFNHGGTRQRAIRALPNAEAYIFLTQDALLDGPQAMACLLRRFEDPAVGAVYGRQLPHHGAGPIEAHARLYNYPPNSLSKKLEDRKRLGIKTAFISNSFAAYRAKALEESGGFPEHVIFGEDTFACARILITGWKVEYCADAVVRHSHGYGFGQEFRRYFDIGVLHSRERWMLETFGKPEGEGLRFVQSEMRHLRERPWLIGSALLRTALKLGGYRLGSLEQWLPRSLKRRLSMHAGFWG